MILPSSTGTVTGSRAGELKDPLCSKQQNSPASGQIIKNCHVGTKGPITTAMKQAVASIGRLSFCPFSPNFLLYMILLGFNVKFKVVFSLIVYAVLFSRCSFISVRLSKYQ